jgi:hypothetical protein
MAVTYLANTQKIKFFFMSQQNSTANARIVYANAAAIVAKANLSLKGAKLTQSALRLEQAASLTKTQYVFPALVNNNGAANTLFNTEIRLNLQDSFVVSSWGWFLAKPATAVDTTFVLQTYANPLIFPVGLLNLEVLYNSIVQVAVNNDIILPVWDMNRHRMVPQTQQVAVSPAAVTQFDGSSDGYYPVEPNFLLVGSKNSVITLTLPAAFATLDANIRIVTILRGVLAQNSTSIT